ncbi:MAG TPA: ATP-binding protein [Bacteroidia bacterium]|nr:ATP-binding protein [Bacteroidia bacterium]
MIKLYRKIIFTVAAAFFFFSGVRSQSMTTAADHLRDTVSLLCASGDYDSAQSAVLHFLDRKDLLPEDVFTGNFLFADVLKASGKPRDAIAPLLATGKLLDSIPHPERFRSLMYGDVAECYFTLQQYDSAQKYSLLSIDASPDTSFRSGGHAVNDMIIGYNEFLSKKYSVALDYYGRAMLQYTSYGESCELPLVYAKIARVNNAMGERKLAEENISRSIRISDSCGIDDYVLLSERTLFEIYRENGDYKNALSTLEEVNTLVQKIEERKKTAKMNELKVKYETQLVEKDNERLRNENRKNEEILERQRLALYIALLATVILTFLILLLVRISSQRKKAEAKLAALNSELEEKVKDRTEHLEQARQRIEEDSKKLLFQNKQLIDFCNIISHNLRSPLVNMSMLVDFIEKSNDASEQKQFIEKLKPVIGNLNETFGELLESLQVKQDVEVRSERINLEDCLKRTLETLEAEVIGSGAVITHDFSAADSIVYPPKYLYSIFQNLVSNAIKYRQPGRKPEIRLLTKREGKSIVLSVKDNGLGIDMEKNGHNLFKIRKVFHQHPDAKGFGLFITKTQVEAMGGKIRAESEPGNGSVFFVEFTNQDI